MLPFPFILASIKVQDIGIWGSAQLMDFPSQRQAVREQCPLHLENPELRSLIRKRSSGDCSARAWSWAGQPTILCWCIFSYQAVLSLNSRQTVKGNRALQTAFPCTKHLNYNYCQHLCHCCGRWRGKGGILCHFTEYTGSPRMRRGVAESPRARNRAPSRLKGPL